MSRFSTIVHSPLRERLNSAGSDTMETARGGAMYEPDIGKADSLAALL
jgi:hypothetical protein